jgi:hypothetical protein
MNKQFNHQFLATFLTLGSFISGSILLVGFFLGFDLNSDPFMFFETHDPLTLRDLVNVYLRTKNYSSLVMMSGILLIILLPFFRVFILLFQFLFNKEYILSLSCLFIGICLLISFYLGLGH